MTRIFSKFSNGILVNQIVDYVLINLELLHSTGIGTLLANSPEIFHRVERPSREPLMFDGQIQTYPDLWGSHHKLFEQIRPIGHNNIGMADIDFNW